MNTATNTSKIGTWIKTLGPGIITAALVFGPSKMTITSRLGAEFGYSLTWIIVVAIFFMILFANMGSRIGAAAPDTLLTVIRQKWGRAITIAIGLGIFLVATSFQAGNSVGVGIALGEATGTGPQRWIILFNILGISLLFFRGFYKVLEKLMILLVAMMLVSFLATLLMVQPSIAGITKGLMPSLPTGSTGLVIAFMASCFSLVGAFYQSYLERERIRTATGAAKRPAASTTGMLMLGAMSAVVLFCAAAVLHSQQVKVVNAAAMARALEPLFGTYASNMFFTGLFAASFSSLVGNATVGGSMLGDALGWGKDLNSKAVKILIAVVMTAGASVALLFGKLPLEMIVLAQSITIFLVPFIGWAMFSIANDGSIMGAHKNTPLQKWMALAGLLLVVFLAAGNVYELFIK
ncbi:Nramp family divalent metal transporter [Flavihumibacter stibioxidans]|uniref:Manganese transporter n=1 Tax=Flavihumibacter stibioxidans TaxID=1834163 RepID=A0ABR7M9I2_9BACT|nr:Nramp family divalent metal transporter [Flavihumibacter stibioxidans]MBC6491395.1 manganese transporter [Flavihumibacter stibioxidans]